MSAENNLDKLIKNMTPKLNEGEFVFLSVKDASAIDRASCLFEFKEAEGVTILMEQSKADKLNLDYNFIASWLTLEIHSSLSAVGLTAAFSTELTNHNISCNVVAGFYHDHIFVDKNDGKKALEVLQDLSKKR